jgi:hypothetical protein
MVAIAVAAVTLCVATPVVDQFKCDFSTSACDGSVHGELNKHKFVKADVKDISYVRHGYDVPGMSETKSITAWVALNSCTGDVVIEMNPSCGSSNIYTRGDCTIPGLKGN